MSDLVERVARELGAAQYDMLIRQRIRKTIAIALEEAAKVADEAGDCIDGKDIADAIRAMIPSGNDPAPDDNADSK